MRKKQRIATAEPLLVKVKNRIFRNRQYKDRLFKLVFRDKKYLLELYNALNGSVYTDDDELEVVTMEDVVFLKMKNDLSFIIGDTLNLYEHQSTVNNNIALRMLLYFARQYEAIVRLTGKSVYGRRITKLPFPQGVVFYNGNEKIPEDYMLKLSDAYILPDSKAERLVPAVECTVRVININYGYNKDIASKCKRLEEYSRFIQIVKDCDMAEPDKNKAMEMAIDIGIRENLLSDILTKEKSEVKSMLLTEFDEKAYREAVYEDGYEDGINAAIIALVKKDMLSADAAAKELGISESEFTELMEQWANPFGKPSKVAE